MTSALKNRLLFGSVLLLALPLARAQAPNGTVTFTFTRTNFPVWDFTGAYTFNQEIAGVGATQPLSVPVYITQDFTGRLHGSGLTQVSIGSDVVLANFTISGNLSQSGSNTCVAFSIQLTGNDFIADVQRKFSVSLRYNLRVDPNLANPPAWIAPLHGNAVSGTVNIAGLGTCPVIPGSYSPVPLPARLNTPPWNLVDGGWTVTMYIEAFARLGGVATIAVHSTAPGDQPIIQPPVLTLNANLTGTYQIATGLSQVTLTGMSDSPGTSLQLTFATGATTPTHMVGRILGQSFSY